MKLDLKKLPTDIALLHKIINDLTATVDSLTHKLALLRKKQFGVSEWTVYRIRKNLNAPLSTCQKSPPKMDPFVEMTVSNRTDENPQERNKKTQNSSLSLTKAVFIFDELSLTLEGTLSHTQITSLLACLNPSC